LIHKPYQGPEVVAAILAVVARAGKATDAD
jgi:hypothetical protein